MSDHPFIRPPGEELGGDSTWSSEEHTWNALPEAANASARAEPNLARVVYWSAVAVCGTLDRLTGVLTQMSGWRP